jgi:hypothetical protein
VRVPACAPQLALVFLLVREVPVAGSDGLLWGYLVGCLSCTAKLAGSVRCDVLSLD